MTKGMKSSEFWQTLVANLVSGFLVVWGAVQSNETLVGVGMAGLTIKTSVYAYGRAKVKAAEAEAEK